MTKEEAYGCLYSHGLNDEQITEIIKAITHKPYERFLPCKYCGCNRRATWFGTYSATGDTFVRLVCRGCGLQIDGKNEADAKRKWNERMREESE